MRTFSSRSAGDGHPLLKLAERAVHQLHGVFGAVDAQQVESHVVVGQELGLHDQALAHRDLVDGPDLHVGLLEDHAVAAHVDPAPAGAAHQLGQLAGGEGGEGHPVELGEGRDDHRARGHVDAERQRLGGKHDLDQAAGEELLDQLLVVGHEAGVVHGQPAPHHLGVDHPAVERGFVGVTQRSQAVGGQAIDARLLVWSGEVQLVI